MPCWAVSCSAIYDDDVTLIPLTHMRNTVYDDDVTLIPLTRMRNTVYDDDVILIPLTHMRNTIYDAMCQCYSPGVFSAFATRTAGYQSFGPIEKIFMFSVTFACARRTGAAARVERRRRER